MTTTTGIEDRIVALTNEWYSLVGRDHHKDRDCHFYICKTWSYGQPPTYVVQHDGYVWDKVIDETFATSQAAHEFLVHKLEQMVAEERKHD